MSSLIVVEQAYHRRGSESPSSVTSRFQTTLTTDELPYGREQEVGEEWVALDTGPVSQCSMLILVNEPPPRRQVRPTPQEIDADNAKVVDVGLVVGDSVEEIGPILPTHSIRIFPKDLSRLRVRCRQGTSRVTPHVFPV